MKILVTGGTGFVGRHVVERLLAEKQDVRLLLRPTGRMPESWVNRVEVFIGDLGDHGLLAAAVQGCDTLVNIANTMKGGRAEMEQATVAGTQHLLAAAKASRVARLVHVSSMAVLPMGLPFRLRKLPEEPLYETDPQYLTDYAVGKIATEQAALELAKNSSVAVAVLRPGIVYGPGGGWRVSRVGTVVGNRVFLLGGGRHPLPFVYVENLADAIVQAALHEREASGIFNIIDDYSLSARELVQGVRATVSPGLKIIAVPRFVCRALALPLGIVARRLKRINPLHAGQVDGCSLKYEYATERARDVLHWRPPCGKEEALSRSLHSWAAKGQLPRTADLKAVGTYRGEKPPVRVALVGCGGIAGDHARFLQGLTHVKLVACCDTDLGRATAFAQKHGVAHTFGSLDQLLEFGTVDAVHVLTPPTATHAVATRCLRAGLHVLVEKPMTMSAAQCGDLYQTAREMNRLVCVDHNHALDQVMVEARRWLASGQLGEIIWMESYYGFDLRGNPGNPFTAPDGAKNWNFQLPGGLFQNVLPHPLSVVAEFLPDPVTVAAQARNFNLLAFQPNDELRLVLTTPRAGASVTVSLSSSPRFQTLMIYCTTGAIQVDFVYKLIRVYRNVPGLPKAIQRFVANVSWGKSIILRNLEMGWKTVRGSWVHYDGMERLIAEFHTAILTAGEPPVREDVALRTMRIMDETWRQVGPQNLSAVPRGLVGSQGAPR